MEQLKIRKHSGQHFCISVFRFFRDRCFERAEKSLIIAHTSIIVTFLRKIHRKYECLARGIGNASVEDRVQIDGEKTAFVRFVKIAFFPRRVHRRAGNGE